MRRRRSHSAGRAVMRPGASPAYAAPKMYRTRRRVLRRLVIPGILAAIMVGAAIGPLRQAGADLRGAGPADPYEAYANYNLGYALLQVGDCADALPPLEVANRLETSPLVDAAIRRAESCARQGS